MGLSSVTYLRQLYPDAYIIYGVPKWVAPLYKDCETDANEILPLDFSSLRSWWKLWWILKKKSIDTIFEMHLSGRSKKFFDLFSSFNAIYYHFHNHHIGLDQSALTEVHDQGKIKPLIQRDLDGVWSTYAKDSKPPHFLNFSPQLKIKNNDESKNQVILGVVATRATKMWPLENYEKLAHLIRERTDYKVIIPLSDNLVDRNIEKVLLQHGLPENVTILKASISELPTRLSNSKFYIGNDTGLKHLSISLGIKTYTFFGPEPPMEWHPYDPEQHPYFYKQPLECRTKDAHYCGLSECESMICLNEFLPEDIFKSIFESKEKGE
jgi:heptosyltransferase II